MTHPTAGRAFPTGTILGYPRIGRRRKLKTAVEAFWAGSITADELKTRAAELRSATRERLASLGLGRTDSSMPTWHAASKHALEAAVARLRTAVSAGLVRTVVKRGYRLAVDTALVDTAAVETPT
jgi:hypothetical protein